MSTPEPKPGVLEGVLWDELAALEEHAQELSRGKEPITAPVYRALWAEGLRLTNQHPELLDTLRMFAPPGFFES